MRLIDADALEDLLGCSDENINFKYLLREAPTIDIDEKTIFIINDYYHMEKIVEGQKSQNARLRKINENIVTEINILKKALECACADVEEFAEVPAPSVNDYIRHAQEENK